MRLINPSYRLFIMAAVALLAASFFTPHRTTDIYFLDTYYVFEQASLFRILAFGLFLLWLLYMVNRQFLYSGKLTLAHVLLTLVSLVVVLGAVLRTDTLRKGGLSVKEMSEYHRWGTALQYAIVALAAVQILLLVNVVMGLTKALKHK